MHRDRSAAASEGGDRLEAAPLARLAWYVRSLFAKQARAGCCAHPDRLCLVLPPKAEFAAWRGGGQQPPVDDARHRDDERRRRWGSSRGAAKRPPRRLKTPGNRR